MKNKRLFVGMLMLITVLMTAQSASGHGCLNVLDGRLNNSTALDCGAPIVLFLSEPDENGFAYLEILGAGNGRVSPALRIASIFWELAPPAFDRTLIEIAGNPNNGQPVGVYLMRDGTVLIETAYADGKSYVIRYDPDGQQRIIYVAW